MSDWQLNTTDVVQSLLDGINEFMNPSGDRLLYLARHPIPVAIGCTYRFTSVPIAKALPVQSCIVVDKSAVGDHGSRTLLARGEGLVLNTLGDEFRWIGRPNSDGSYPEWIDSEVGLGDAGVVENIRAAGEGYDPARPQRVRPLIHAKVLVLGYRELDVENEWGHLVDQFTLDRAWIGSANFSNNADRSTEIGLWVTDRQLVRDLWRFVVDLIQRSEPPTSISISPAPDLVDMEPDWEPLDWDDD